jgi:hypothetical protein
MKLKYNIWHIDAYYGWSDYDGPEDCNVHQNYVFNASWTKKEVMDAFVSKYDGYRSIAISKCELVSSGEIEY